MKVSPFFVVLIFVILLMLVASRMFADLDLTPDTPPATPAPGREDMGLLRVPPGGSGGTGGFTSTGGPCLTPYIVQPGDTLFSIARACGVTLADLLAANPGLTNPNVIHPNQVLNIPYAQQAAASAPLSAAAGGDEEFGKSGPVPLEVATQAPTATVEIPLAVPTATGGAGSFVIPGHRPGDMVPVEIGGLPPQARFRMEYGTSGGQRYELGEATSGADGVLRMSVIIPPMALPGEQWFVYAQNIDAPGQISSSPPIDIGGPLQ